MGILTTSLIHSFKDVGRMYTLSLGVKGIWGSLLTTDDVDAICKCIVAGFFANAARLHPSGSYRYCV